MNRIIRLPEVKEMTGLSRSTIFTAMKLGKFPKSFKISDNATGWMLDDIEAWVDKVSSNRKLDNE